MTRLSIALALLLIGCSDSTDAPALAAVTDAPTEASALVYLYNSDAEIRATYPDLEHAEIIYAGQTHQLDFLPASPKNGAEYANST